MSCGGATSQVASEPTPGAEGAGNTAPGPGQAAELNPTPVRAESLTEDGLSLLRAGRIEEGRDALMKAVDTGAAGALAYFNLAVAEYRLGDSFSAGENARVAVQLSGRSDKSVNLYSQIMLSAGKPHVLRSVLDDLVEGDPDSVAVENMVARAKIAQGKAADGLRHASNLLKKDQTNVEVMKTIARAYLAMKRNEAASLVMHQTLELKRDAEVLDMLGQMSARKGKGREAIVYFKEALDLDSNLIDARNNLGVLYHEAGDYTSAAAEFKVALAQLPDYSIAHMNLGNSYRKLLQFEKAEKAYRAAIEIESNCADCYFNLGVNALENKGIGKDEPGHYRKAIEYFTRYKEIRGGPPGRDDKVEKYLDEARRMSEYLEKEARMMEEQAVQEDEEEEVPEDEESLDEEEFEPADDDEWVDEDEWTDDEEWLD